MGEDGGIGAHVTFHDVDAAALAALRDRVVTQLEGSAGERTVACLGVRATYAFDAGARQLHVRFDAVPRIVTRGFVTGWLHDALGALAVAPGGGRA